MGSPIWHFVQLNTICCYVCITNNYKCGFSSVVTGICSSDSIYGTVSAVRNHWVYVGNGSWGALSLVYHGKRAKPAHASHGWDDKKGKNRAEACAEK